MEKTGVRKISNLKFEISNSHSPVPIPNLPPPIQSVTASTIAILSPMIDDEPQSGARTSLRTAALATVLACVLTQGVVTHDPFPWWAEDATVLAVPSTGLFPLGAILLNLVTILAAGVVCLTNTAERGRIVRGQLVQTALLLVGAVGVAAHAAFVGGGSIDNVVIGLSWLSALSAGVAACSIRDNPKLVRMTFGTLLAGLAMIAIKAGVQTFIEHPATVATFRANKEAFFAARGWSVGSPMARSFEHRLVQPDATGWFGLSNIVSTFGAAASVASLGLLLAARRLGAALMFFAGFTLLVLGGSKGGYAAACLGVCVLAAAFLVPRFKQARLSSVITWLPLAAILGVTTAVIARGLIGEQLGERSILFRAYYLEASARIFTQHPLLGTGPDGYQAAYMLAKNPLSPEEISSPHHVLLDFACTLGLPGLAWGLLWLVWVLRLGPALLITGAVPEPSDTEPVNVRDEIRPIFLVFAAATVLGTLSELATATPESAGVRFGGLFAATTLAAFLLPLLSPAAAGPVLAAGGVVLAMLGLLDMAPINAGSAGWYAMLLAGSGAASTRLPLVRLLRFGIDDGTRASRVLWLAVVGGTLVLVAWAAPGVARWQANLRESFDAVAPASRLHAEMDDIFSGRVTDADARQTFADNLKVLGVDVQTTPGPEIARRVQDHRLSAAIDALPLLQIAAADQPSHHPTREAACRLQLQIATWLHERGETKPALEAASNALALTIMLSTNRPHSASTFAWRATVIEAVADIRNDPPHLWVPMAVQALTAAAAADPYGVQHPARLAELLATHSKPIEAASWAQKALDLSANTRLDPSGTRTLPPERAARLKKIIEAARVPIKPQPPG